MDCKTMTKAPLSGEDIVRSYPLPADEEWRLAALDQYAIAGTSPEAEYDHICQLAAALFNAPTALVSFVERDRQFFKARVGFEASETSRDSSFCAHALVRDDVLVVPDALEDSRFRQNPLVTGVPFIRFYAGAPVATASGHRIGSVCVIDKKPRPPLTDGEKGLLRALAQLTSDHLERRRLNVIGRAAFELAAATPDAIVCADGKGQITYWNPSAETMFARTRQEALGQPFKTLIAADWQPTLLGELERARRGDKRKAGTVALTAIRNDGSPFPAEVSVAFWQEGERDQYGVVLRDVSERHAERERLRYLTHFDRLTDLSNRARFLERVDEELVRQHSFAVLKIGLDRFKEINGAMGMAAGDDVLRKTAERIVAMAGPGTFVARLGADEFGVLLTGTTDPSGVLALSEHILAVIAEPFEIPGFACHVGASAGVVLAPGPSQFSDANGILKAALLSLHQAKKEGGRRSALFRPQLGKQADERLRLEEELRSAFERGEFELHFQPQVRLADEKWVGAEALIRWHHPERGMLSPAVFLPMLEVSSIAPAVGQWILTEACTFAAELAQREAPLRIGVNLFASQLRDGMLPAAVTQALMKSGLLPHLLELEITETTVLGLDSEMIEPLRQLRAMGIGIAFDDYGTGFASLSLLKRYPLTRLKIDRDFIKDLGNDREDEAIVRAVLALGDSLGLDVIAEGMETRAQASILKNLGCAEAQGYLFGKPMKKDEFVRTAKAADLLAAA